MRAQMAVASSTAEALYRHRREVPTALPILLLALATVAAFIAPLQLLLALVAMELTYLAISMGGIRRLLQTAVQPMAVLIAPFLLLSAVIQAVVSGIDISILTLSAVRVALLYLTAIVSIRMLSMARLVRDMSRVSPLMALSIAVGIRMLTIGLYTLNEVKAIYSTNIATKCSHFKCRVEYTTLLAKAITRVFIYTVLDVGESIYSRYSCIWIKQHPKYIKNRNCVDDMKIVPTSSLSLRWGSL
ncbi:MAG: hypothetical protein QXF17_02250 [Ignisphaera sp.]